MKSPVSVLLLLCLLLPAAAQEPAIRAVWVQQVSGDPEPRAAGTTFRLMARELPGEARPLLPGPANFSRPLLSSDGQTVYYTDRRATAGESGTSYAPEMFAVPFAGGAPRSLGSGMAVAVWHSPEGVEFIYALTSLQTSRRPSLTGELLVRFQPLTPDEREIMWSDSPLGADNFQLSRDGTRAAGLFPAPQAGLADTDARTFSPLAQGSFPILAPDNSYALGLLDGDQRRLRIFVPNVQPDWHLLPAQSLPAQGGEVNHLRWTNDPLHIALSGPPASGTAPDIYLATLRPDLKAIERTVPLTTDPAPDYYPDVWLPRTTARTTALTQNPVVTTLPATAPWPLTRDALHFSWENIAASDAAPDPFTLHGHATPGPHGSLDISAGWADTTVEALAPFTSAASATGSLTIEALITERTTPAPVSLRLLNLRLPDHRDALALYRVDRTLVLRILTGTGLTERHTLTTLAIDPDRPFSATLTLHAGHATFYLDGQKMKDIPLDQPGLQSWHHLRLLAGDPTPYGNPWTGRIERIALYSRALADAEVADAWRATQALLTLRPRPTTLKVKARLLEFPALPPAPHNTPRQLHASAWEIEQTYLGYLKPGRITLLQWSVLDGKPAPLPQIKPGQSIELLIEPLDDRPELRAVPAHNTLPGEHPVYHDITPPGRHPKPFPLQ